MLFCPDGRLSAYLAGKQIDGRMAWPLRPLTPRQTGSAATARFSGPDRGPGPEACSCQGAATLGHTRREPALHWKMDRVETEGFPLQQISPPHCRTLR